MSDTKPRTAERCQRQAKKMQKNWQDPKFRARMIKAQVGAGLRTYPT